MPLVPVLSARKLLSKTAKSIPFGKRGTQPVSIPVPESRFKKSITGKTQKEVSQKLKAATAAIDAGTYIAPNKMTVGEWLDIWATDYLGNVKPFTVVSYKGQINNHIKPALGAIKLEALNTHTIQSFYNGLGRPAKDRPGLSPKTIKVSMVSCIRLSSRR